MPTNNLTDARNLPRHPVGRCGDPPVAPVTSALSATASCPLVIIEVQCGDYLGEDDIERLDDVYGRARLAGESSCDRMKSKAPARRPTGKLMRSF